MEVENPNYSQFYRFTTFCAIIFLMPDWNNQSFNTWASSCEFFTAMKQLWQFVSKKCCIFQWDHLSSFHTPVRTTQFSSFSKEQQPLISRSKKVQDGLRKAEWEMIRMCMSLVSNATHWWILYIVNCHISQKHSVGRERNLGQNIIPVPMMVVLKQTMIVMYSRFAPWYWAEHFAKCAKCNTLNSLNKS